jgi:hypothetical protein
LTLNGSEFLVGQLTPTFQILELKQQFRAISRSIGITLIPGAKLQSRPDQYDQT